MLKKYVKNITSPPPSKKTDERNNNQLFAAFFEQTKETKKMPAASFICSLTLPTAFAAPVEEGMMLNPAPRPPRQSFLDGPSTVF